MAAVRRITTSEGAEILAKRLGSLPLFVGLVDATDADMPTSAEMDVKEILCVLDAANAGMRERGVIFAGGGTASDTVMVHGREYPSAHHAAYGEASRIMDRLWFHLDPDGWVSTGKDVFTRDEGGELALQRKINGTGLDPSRITSDWDRAKAGLIELLPIEWRRDFDAVQPRIIRERALARLAYPELAKPLNHSSDDREETTERPDVKRRRDQVEQLTKDGKKPGEIASILKVDATTIRQDKKRRNL